MKNKAGLIHKQDEEKRAMVAAKKSTDNLKAEELAAKYRATGTVQRSSSHALKTAFTTKKEYGRGEWEAQWATDQRTLTGLRAPNANDILKYKTDYRELYELAEQA
ncbi:hypothetical protein Tco_1242633 [Tanacetum coccineum]